MSIYHPSFNFLNQNSYDHYKLIVVHFDGDNGEIDTSLGMEPIYSESFDGARRLDYGAKFNSVAQPRVSVIKEDGTDFTTEEVRNVLKWMTGSRKNSYLELCEWNYEDETWSSYLRFLGRATAVYQQKLDARTVGLIFEFTTVSPFAYSPLQLIDQDISGDTTIQTLHQSDDFDTPINLDITFTSSGQDDTLTISSGLMTAPTKISGIAKGETINIDSNGFITSSTGRSLSNSFNYVFPQVGYDVDLKKIETINVHGSGHLVVKYIYFIKLGDVAIDVDVSSGGISCGQQGCTGGGSGETVVVGEVTWNNIKNKPTTLAGYGVDAEVDAKINNSLASAQIDIDEEELNAMLDDVLT